MNILIVTSHPLRDSLCHTFANQIYSKLNTMGHTVVMENLYESIFDPVLSADERKSYYHGIYDFSGVSPQVKRLLQADGIVILFPTWWFGFPAILKGWFDRVWAPTVAYDHADDFGPIRPKLDQLKKALVVTTVGAPWWVDRFILWRPLKRIIKYALLGACAKNCKLKYLSFYKCEMVKEERLKSFASRIDSALIKWFQ